MSIQEMINTNDINGLTNLLENGSKEERLSIIEALKERKGSDTVGLLIKTLNNEDQDTRNAAAVALGRTLGEVAIGPLSEALKDNDWNVRFGAAWALGLIETPEAVTHLIDAAQDENSSVRERVAISLGGAKDVRAIDILINALSDDDSVVQATAASALGTIADDTIGPTASAETKSTLASKAVDPLIQMMSNKDSSIRKEATSSLGAIDDAKAIGPLIGAFKDGHEPVRRSAAAALSFGRNLGRHAIEPLIKALRHENRNVRELSAFCLGNIGNPIHHDNSTTTTVREKAVGPLRNALNDSQLWVQERASEALKKIEKGRK